MRATANVISAIPEVRIEHNGESLPFSISVFTRKSFQKDYDVFEQINQYWESCTIEVQDAIFAVYKEILFGFDNIWSKHELTEYLTDRVVKLVDMHDLDDIQAWISFKSNIVIPDKFGVEYIHSIDNNTSREKTYTRADYVKLVAMSLALRCMIPVWGEYITTTRQTTGTQYKEFYAFELISKSKLNTSLPMEKLKLYIDRNIGDDKNDPNITLSGLSSEDFGYWLLALICIRRLCLGDIRGINPDANLATFIFKFIIQKTHSTDSNVENIVREKKIDDHGTDGENKISSLERYKIKANISLGEIVELEYSMRDMVEVASKLSSRLDPYMLNRSLETCSALMHEKLLDPQMTLLRWVFKPVISPKGLMYLSKELTVKAIGAMEAILWARGHKYLAILSSSYPAMSDAAMMVSPVDSKKRVPDELIAELDRLYPFKKAINSKKSAIKETNLAARSIDIVSDNLTMFNWRPTAHESMLQEVFGNTNRKVPIRPDVKIDLTKLVVEIGNRAWDLNQ